MIILLTVATLKGTGQVIIIVVIIITNGGHHTLLLEHNQQQNRRKAAVQPLLKVCHWKQEVVKCGAGEGRRRSVGLIL
jgi:hypothetical protein